jgi:hypothetical protein
LITQKSSSLIEEYTEYSSLILEKLDTKREHVRQNDEEIEQLRAILAEKKGKSNVVDLQPENTVKK